MATHQSQQPGMTMWWTDESGTVHICESAAPIGTELLIRTLCDREVETGAAFVPSEHHEISCSKCAAADNILKHRAQNAERQTRPALKPRNADALCEVHSRRCH